MHVDTLVKCNQLNTLLKFPELPRSNIWYMFSRFCKVGLSNLSNFSCSFVSIYRILWYRKLLQYLQLFQCFIYKTSTNEDTAINSMLIYLFVNLFNVLYPRVVRRVSLNCLLTSSSNFNDLEWSNSL